MIALVSTADGTFAVDLESGEIDAAEPFDVPPPPTLNLPRVVAASASGSTIVALLDARPPLYVSHDAGATWRESGRGLPAGCAVAVADTNPDVMVFAARNRLYLSRDGGVFWTSLAGELPEIDALAIREG